MARSKGETLAVGIALLVFLGPPLYFLMSVVYVFAQSLFGFTFQPVEMNRSKEDVQECAVIASNLASGDRVQERLFDVCLEKGWDE